MKYTIQNIVSDLISEAVNSPRLEARILLSYLLCKESSAITNEDYELSPEQIKKLKEMIEARKRHIPLDKIIGRKGFYKYEYRVTEDVLSPRPDTEILVEKAIELAKENEYKTILDLGLGSGCILFSVLKDCPFMQGVGVDISEKAIAVAQENAKLLEVEGRVRIFQLSWMEKDFTAHFGEKFDIIVSNPPYIPSMEIDSLEKEVKDHDPRLALDGGQDGLEHYKRIAEIIPELLSPQGSVLLEGGKGQAKEISNLFEKQGLKVQSILKDLSGIERCVLLKK